MTPTPTASDGLGTLAGNAFGAYRSGDRERLSELVDLVTPVLWNAARSQGANPTTCEDAVQTAFLQLVGRADSIKEPAAVLGWLVVVVKREVWRIGRGSRREIGVEQVPEAPTPDYAVIAASLGMPVGSIGPTRGRCLQKLRVTLGADTEWAV